MHELLSNAVAGGCAGLLVDAVLFPIDTVKTRLQSARSGLPAPPIAAHLYRGLSSALLGSFPAAAAFWTTYLHLRNTLLTSGAVAPGSDWVAHAAAAAGADVVVACVRNPFEVVKQQAQAGLHRGSPAAGVRAILASSGPRGLWAGLPAVLLRDVPFSAIQFVLYERAKREWQGVGAGGGALAWWQTAVCGAGAGGVAAAVTTPLDVVKTRLMTQTGVAAGLQYTGAVDAARRIVREEGAAALLRGVVPRVLWISIGGAIFFAGFEAAQGKLRGGATAAGAEADVVGA